MKNYFYTITSLIFFVSIFAMEDCPKRVINLDLLHEYKKLSDDKLADKITQFSKMERLVENYDHAILIAYLSELEKKQSRLKKADKTKLFSLEQLLRTHGYAFEPHQFTEVIQMLKEGKTGKWEFEQSKMLMQKKQ